MCQKKEKEDRRQKPKVSQMKRASATDRTFVPGAALSSFEGSTRQQITPATTRAARERNARLGQMQFTNNNRQQQLLHQPAGPKSTNQHKKTEATHVQTHRSRTESTAQTKTNSTRTTTRKRERMQEKKRDKHCQEDEDKRANTRETQIARTTRETRKGRKHWRGKIAHSTSTCQQ